MAAVEYGECPGLSKSTPLRPGRDFTSYVTRYGFAFVRVAVCLRDLCTNSLALQITSVSVVRDGGWVTFLQSVMIGYISTNDLLLLAINMTKQHELS